MRWLLLCLFLAITACTTTRQVIVPAATSTPPASSYTADRVLDLVKSWPLLDPQTITSRSYLTLSTWLDAKVKQDCTNADNNIHWEARLDGPGRWEVHADFHCLTSPNANTWEFYEEGPRLLGVSGQATEFVRLR